MTSVRPCVPLSSRRQLPPLSSPSMGWAVYRYCSNCAAYRSTHIRYGGLCVSGDGCLECVLRLLCTRTRPHVPTRLSFVLRRYGRSRLRFGPAVLPACYGEGAAKYRDVTPRFGQGPARPGRLPAACCRVGFVFGERKVSSRADGRTATAVLWRAGPFGPSLPCDPCPGMARCGVGLGSAGTS